MHSHRYRGVSFHHDGDFTGSVLVTASSLATANASPSSSEPSLSRATAVATFDTLEQLAAACTSERQEYVDLVGPDSDRHNRFEVCDNAHVRVLAGPWQTVTVCFRRDELLEFLRLAVAHRATRRVVFLAKGMLPLQLAGDARAEMFFRKLGELLEEYPAPQSPASPSTCGVEKQVRFRNERFWPGAKSKIH